MVRPSIHGLILVRSVSLACGLALLPASLLLIFWSQPEYGSTPLRFDVTALNAGYFAPTAFIYVESDGLKLRQRFDSYQDYLQLQLNKTLNSHLRKVWSTTDWRRKVDVFSSIFGWFLEQGLVESGNKVLCIGARMGQEVLAFKEIGVADVIGIDLIPAPPLVLQGDFHKHSFANSTFDFEFSNAFDHSLFPQTFISEIERTLKPHGVAVLHVALHKRPDKFSANDLLSVDALIDLFKVSDIVHIREVDAFGLDTEVAMRKKTNSNALILDDAQPASNCLKSRLKVAIMKLAEPLIITEPKRPWITLKENMKAVKYLSTVAEMSIYKRFIYVDIGARNYRSSIGSWFKKKYPKQGKNFIIYAIEADTTFQSSYSNHSEVTFVPYAAWVRNESVMFGSDTLIPKGHRSTGHVGMGRIQHFQFRTHKPRRLDTQLIEVQGFDFVEWLRTIAGDDDFLLLKMDVEGAEFALLPRLMDTGVVCLVDELFLECHYDRWQSCCPERTKKYNRSYEDCLHLFQSLRQNGVFVHQWW